MTARTRTATVDTIVLYLAEEAWKAIARNGEKTDGHAPSGDDILRNLDTMRTNFATALDVAQKFGVRKETAARIVREYLERSEKEFRLTRSVSLPDEWVILEFVKLSKSTKLANRFLRDCAKNGSRKLAQETAQFLGRKLNAEEIGLLVDDYCDGASSSGLNIEQLAELAQASLGEEQALAVIARIEKREKEFASHCD